MRSLTNILIAVLIIAVVLAVYIFVVKGQFNKRIVEQRGKLESARVELQEIQRMEQEIPNLVAQLPKWRYQLDLLKGAIPEQVDDQVFFSYLARQMDKHGVHLLGIDTVKGGPWLGNLNDKQVEELQGRGIDTDAAKQIQVALVSIRFHGGFSEIVNAFEGLKGYNRIFAIDQVLGPATGSSGMINEQVDQTQTPLELIGKLYYGIPDSYMSPDQLEEVFQSAVISPKARMVQEQITGGGKMLLDGKLDRMDSTEPMGNETGGEEPSSDDPGENHGSTQ